MIQPQRQRLSSRTRRNTLIYLGCHGRTYYDRKRAQGKTHTAALLCLARRRTDVLHAMIRTSKTYQPPALQPAQDPSVAA